jgi:hypothetical protein
MKDGTERFRYKTYKNDIDKFKDALKLIGLANPELLESKLKAIELEKLEFDIIKMRYIDGLYIKQIPEFVGKGERWLKKVHAVAIKKVYTRLSAKDLQDLGVHFDFTSKPLYERV